MLVEIVVLDVADLAVGVVDLRARHGDVIGFVPEDSLSLGALLDSGDVNRLFVVFFDCLEFTFSEKALI
jgi:hypothetical protein